MMKKHEREEIQEQLCGALILMMRDAIEKDDLKKAKKLCSLYNRLDRGW